MTIYMMRVPIWVTLVEIVTDVSSAHIAKAYSPNDMLELSNNDDVDRIDIKIVT